MYNRYIPQPDGTFRRSRVMDTGSIPQSPAPPQEPKNDPPEPEAAECFTPQEPEAAECFTPPEPQPHCEKIKQKPEPRVREQPQRQPSCRRSNPRPQHSIPSYTPPKQTRQPPKQEPHDDQKDNSVGSFLRQLLPKDFDTGDLLIVLLLLLMSGDCKEDQNSALLTLAIYLFM